MKIILTDDELKEVLHYCFCNGGLSELRRSDVQLSEDYSAYNKAKQVLIENKAVKQICYEDVLLQILVNGDTITFLDYNDSKRGKKIPLTLNSARENIEACPNAMTYIPGMLDSMDAGDADAFDCWDMLQYMLYRKLVYG